MKKLAFPLLLLSLSLCLPRLLGTPSSAASTFAREDKVSPWVLASTADGAQGDFLVVLNAQADLGAAYALPTKQARGRFVYATLWETAQREQAPLRAWLDAQGVPYRSFYIVNLIHVRAGDRALVEALAARPDVARIEANPHIHNPQPQPQTYVAQLSPRAIESNIQQVNADDVWRMGYTGQDIVIGGQDTGYAWDHPALVNQYRGWDGDSANHDYNWHDAIHSGGGSCGADSPQPCDDYGHGTHTMGIALGSDDPTHPLTATHAVGVAPGARWIGCRDMDVGDGTPATYLECFEFFLAPYPVNGTALQGNPDLAPDVTNNSWGCPPSEGCSWDTLQAAVEAHRAAGILTVSSAGNDGPSCSSVSEPVALYDATYTVGSVNSSDNIVSSSSRGPVTEDYSNRLKPDISAPGLSIRSSTRNGSYGLMSGTSMASPHVAGAVALLWSAQPALRGQIDQTEALLNASALPRYSTQCGDPAGTVPNNVYGWGRLDVLAAVQGTLDPGSAPNSVVGEMLTQVQTTTLYSYVGDLSGEWPVSIGGVPYTLATRYSYSGMPVYKATQYAYEHFQDLGLDVVYHEYTWASNNWRNVVAEQPGIREPERIFLITAHIDDLPSGPIAPGADDNASGSTGVLVAADILSQYDFGCTLRYVLFTGEEQGLRGSTAYASAAHANGDDIEGVLNLDMIAYNSDADPVVDLYARSNISGALGIAETFSQVVTLYDLDLAPTILVDDWLGNYSDNKSFWDQGYPAILAIEDSDDFSPYYHSTGDRLATLDMAYFTHFVKAAVGTLAHMSGLPEWGYLSGVVSDDQGAGLPGATLRAITGTLAYSAATNASGHYTMGARPYTYTVSAWKYGYAPQTLTEVVVPRHATAQANFSLEPTFPYTLSGCVTDTVTGAPLAATVTVLDPLGAPLTATHTLQANGCYTLTLHGSPYTLTAQARLHRPVTAWVNLVSDAVQNFGLTPTTGDGLLWGHVTDLRTGAPVAGATIQFSPGLTSTQSEANGYYEAQLPPRPYTVTVSAPFYVAVTETHVVVPQSNLAQRDYALPASHVVLLPLVGISATLPPGAQLTRSLTISNDGLGGLTFDISSTHVPWLSATPLSGTVGANSTLPLWLTFDAAATGSGTHSGALRFHTNDPLAQPYVDYALTLTVSPPPAFSLVKRASSPRAEVGTPLTFTLTLTNRGGPASGVTLSDTLPAHTLYAQNGTLAGNDVLWRDLNAPASSTLSLSFAVTVTCVPSGTPIVNRAYQVTATEWPTPTRGQAITVTAVNEGLVSDFDFAAPVARNRPVQFTNLSQNATAYTWAFGDGHVSHATHPTRTFALPGPYTVTLTARNLCGEQARSRTLIVHDDHAMTLLPSAATQEAGAGQVVTYTLQLTNTGGLSDTYQLSHQGGRWTTLLSPLGPFDLASGAWQEVQVYVGLPLTATVGQRDLSTVRVSAASGITASSRLTTSIIQPHTFYLPIVLRDG
jgi:serine protease AprX